jgi:hypothetical protein
MWHASGDDPLSAARSFLNMAALPAHFSPRNGLPLLVADYTPSVGTSGGPLADRYRVLKTGSVPLPLLRPMLAVTGQPSGDFSRWIFETKWELKRYTSLRRAYSPRNSLAAAL